MGGCWGYGWMLGIWVVVGDMGGCWGYGWMLGIWVDVGDMGGCFQRDCRRCHDACPNSLHSKLSLFIIIIIFGARGGVVVKALRYKPAGRGFDSRFCHWNFLVT